MTGDQTRIASQMLDRQSGSRLFIGHLGCDIRNSPCQPS
jgi:hypothetical protein